MADVGAIVARRARLSWACGEWWTEAHRALVAKWMQASADVLTAVGLIDTQREQAALLESLPKGSPLQW